jgi:glucokinase
MVFLTFGTGMGAGLILNSRLYRGTNDLAGEVGHIRLEDDGPMGYGKRGSFEGFCTGCGLTNAATDLGLDYSAREVFERAAGGDATCMQLLGQLAKQLGRELAILIDLLNSQKIILGSIYSRQSDMLKSLMLSELSKQALPQSLAACEILPAELGESIGDYAAMAVAYYGDQWC